MTKSNIDFTIEEKGNKGSAIAIVGSNKIGEMTYSIPKGNFFIIDHTEVDESYRGQDVGKQLLMELVEMARKNDIKILPLCPFANAMFKKNPEIQDVLK